MRYLTATAASYAGVDLHATSLHLCVLDQAGTVRLSRKLKAQPEPFLDALAPFRPDVLIGCECVHTWYWARGCDAATRGCDVELRARLGHEGDPHQSKTKSDAHDAERHRLDCCVGAPSRWRTPTRVSRRGLRDLLRTRLRLVRQRGRTLRPHPHRASATEPRLQSDAT